MEQSEEMKEALRILREDHGRKAFEEIKDGLGGIIGRLDKLEQAGKDAPIPPAEEPPQTEPEPAPEPPANGPEPPDKRDPESDPPPVKRKRAWWGDRLDGDT